MFAYVKVFDQTLCHDGYVIVPSMANSAGPMLISLVGVDNVKLSTLFPPDRDWETYRTNSTVFAKW